VGWLLLGGLCIIWVAFLVPGSRKQVSAAASVNNFERRMELLAQAEVHGTAGRWIVTPRKGARFVGPAERQRARARERRKQVFVFLLEAIGITFLIGLVPPLRVLWSLSLAFGALLGIYVALLISIKTQALHARPMERVREAQPVPTERDVSPRYVADGRGTWARPTLNGLGTLEEGDHVHVIVRPAELAVQA
jgi:hypothetical protein